MTISTNLPTGTYYFSLDGIGVGDPKVTGYSDYASLGQYTISGTLPSDSAWLPTPGGSYSWTNLANEPNQPAPPSYSVRAVRLSNNHAPRARVLPGLHWEKIMHARVIAAARRSGKPVIQRLPEPEAAPATQPARTVTQYLEQKGETRAAAATD